MPVSLTRRAALARTILALTIPRGMRGGDGESLAVRLTEIEKRSGGRLGCAVLDTSIRSVIGYRTSERFPMCSTFKASAAAFVLERADRGAEQLDRRIVFSPGDILPASPITKLHVRGNGMSIAELCSAAITVSDNTAANLLLSSFGGPAALTAFFRSIGDTVTRLDRNEPELNEGAPGDPRDTTSPAAMLEDLRKFVFGNVLRPESRKLFANWLVANKTGGARLRAGLPRDWAIGDKTGTGDNATSNDIAVIWPSNRKPFVVTAFLTQGAASGDEREAILADVGRTIAHEIASTG